RRLPVDGLKSFEDLRERTRVAVSIKHEIDNTFPIWRIELDAIAPKVVGAGKASAQCLPVGCDFAFIRICDRLWPIPYTSCHKIGRNMNPRLHSLTTDH